MVEVGGGYIKKFSKKPEILKLIKYQVATSLWIFNYITFFNLTIRQEKGKVKEKIKSGNKYVSGICSHSAFKKKIIRLGNKLGSVKKSSH